MFCFFIVFFLHGTYPLCLPFISKSAFCNWLSLILLTKQEVYEKVSKSHPEFLHPNLKVITIRPWTAKEFALNDKQVCVIIQEW